MNKEKVIKFIEDDLQDIVNTVLIFLMVFVTGAIIDGNNSLFKLSEGTTVEQQMMLVMLSCTALLCMSMFMAVKKFIRCYKKYHS